MDPVVLTLCILITGLFTGSVLSLWFRDRNRRRGTAATPPSESSENPPKWASLVLGILAGLAWAVLFFLGAQRWPVAAVLPGAALVLVRWGRWSRIGGG